MSRGQRRICYPFNHVQAEKVLEPTHPVNVTSIFHSGDPRMKKDRFPRAAIMDVE